MSSRLRQCTAWLAIATMVVAAVLQSGILVACIGDDGHRGIELAHGSCHSESDHDDAHSALLAAGCTDVSLDLNVDSYSRVKPTKVPGLDGSPLPIPAFSSLSHVQSQPTVIWPVFLVTHPPYACDPSERVDVLII